jgi:hypothetical protein
LPCSVSGFASGDVPLPCPVSGFASGVSAAGGLGVGRRRMDSRVTARTKARARAARPAS